MEVPTKAKIIYDPIYGFIHLNEVEWEIIHSPFYQRLRWIRQLGFSSYVFHGAEHSRYGHSIGVLHNAHKILESVGKAVPDKQLYDPKCMNKDALFHKSLRLGALMHDMGTFPFSHTTEQSYIHFGETTQKSNEKGRRDDHEHLGSFIIKNTDYPGGITQILKKYGFDPQNISDLVKGIDPSKLANQILHSEIDCDRMDYLLRDAHYTGLNYGSYDRTYLLHHFKVVKIAEEEILTVKHNALHCVEDFLNSRFAWYSQVVRSARGAKYDALAERLCFAFLEKGFVHKYSDLLDMIAHRPNEFYTFNDMYFMGKVHEAYVTGLLDKEPMLKSIANALLFERKPKTLHLDEFKQRLLNQDDPKVNEKYSKKAWDKFYELSDVLKKTGNQDYWILPDIPNRHILFVKSHGRIVKGTSSPNILLERDPVKISYDNGDVKLLAEVENSIISRLQNTHNFIPNVFCSQEAYQYLHENGHIPD